jgi:uncharacterized protein
MTADASIDYDSLQLEALRGLVRTVLVRVAKSGLPGEHHLYISFDVRAPGVILSKRLREKYPSEMTIVLQHRFWDLAVNDERFEVKLTFDGIPERLVVPFAAIKVFLDPSVRYVLHFEEPASADSDAQEFDSEEGRTAGKPKKPRAPRARTRTEREAGTRDGAMLSPVQPPAPATLPKGPGVAPTPLGKPKTAGPALAPAQTGGAVENADDGKPAEKSVVSSAQVVSLDAFRKK